VPAPPIGIEHYVLVTIDWMADKGAAARRLLGWHDTAVIEDAALLLILERTIDSMSLVCEALAAHEASEGFEAQETILWVLSPAWISGEVDVPSLLREVRVRGTEEARRGASIAIEWLDSSAVTE
jgi:hypothetical protein